MQPGGTLGCTFWGFSGKHLFPQKLKSKDRQRAMQSPRLRLLQFPVTRHALGLVRMAVQRRLTFASETINRVV